jgi:hypothetical protein
MLLPWQRPYGGRRACFEIDGGFALRRRVMDIARFSSKPMLCLCLLFFYCCCSTQARPAARRADL